MRDEFIFNADGNDENPESPTKFKERRELKKNITKILGYTVRINSERDELTSSAEHNDVAPDSPALLKWNVIE